MIMAYINGDWQYVCRVLGSSVSVCEHSHDTVILVWFFAKKVNRYLRVNGNRNTHAPTKRSSDQSTRGGFVSWGHARSVPKTTFRYPLRPMEVPPVRLLCFAPDGSPAGAPSVYPTALSGPVPDGVQGRDPEVHRSDRGHLHLVVVDQRLPRGTNPRCPQAGADEEVSQGRGPCFVS